MFRRCHLSPNADRPIPEQKLKRTRWTRDRAGCLHTAAVRMLQMRRAADATGAQFRRQIRWPEAAEGVRLWLLQQRSRRFTYSSEVSEAQAVHAAVMALSKAAVRCTTPGAARHWLGRHNRAAGRDVDSPRACCRILFWGRMNAAKGCTHHAFLSSSDADRHGKTRSCQHRAMAAEETTWRRGGVMGRLWTAAVRATKGQASPWKGRVQGSMSSACGSRSHIIMQLLFSAAEASAAAAGSSSCFCAAGRGCARGEP